MKIPNFTDFIQNALTIILVDVRCSNFSHLDDIVISKMACDLKQNKTLITGQYVLITVT